MKTYVSKTMLQNVAVVRVMKFGYPSFASGSEATVFMDLYLTDIEVKDRVKEIFGYAADIYSITRPFVGPLQPTPQCFEVWSDN